MANLLTGIRILCAPLILIFPAFSAPFYLFYLLGGITDAVLFIGGQYSWQAKELVVIVACIIASMAAVQELVSIFKGSRIE